ncbi:hypothetical protein LTR99_009364 [Exophiala xenobiotica]|uniref:SPRY domain-containing protein n=1 Tax=Vermiconidia calcicola TaxID=1690605 RepID=A0AAV9PWP9_9PEZI|nr:hypothetical protein LTR41_003953 [Exophiala xenobiotica]KAK5530962.1 hypothetical protein LTR25_008819 [Vermiconidia calcicola]KAK5228501.1 hypothetical protein LTR72_002385 [Exophiala xenobiotica]KAK5269078.1 hypothetical protein LTR96_005862 [Exophiala xenobiotica]KAK5294558.1 hypothetical protein LTR99_009364 [Exophiala xenobiotica]
MGIFKSLKGKIDVGTDNDDRHQAYTTTEEKRRVFGHSTADNNPQSSSSMMSSEQYAAPPGPPPSHRQRDDADLVAPPPGPPPSHRQRAQQQGEETYLPPPGPPPPSDNPPPYHDWTVIPDTSLLPPPPPLPQDYSPTNNATYDSAARAHEWCDQHPVYTPSRPSADIHTLARTGHLTLERPPPAIVSSKNLTLRQISPTTWSIRTSPSQKQDAIILSSIPLYFAAADNPLLTERPITIHFEIHVQRISNANSGIAIGFAAKPYPPWRLPGWHRASIGVHGDDGRRFVNDSWGGRDFLEEPFKPGETVGVGMRFSTTPAPATGSASGRIGRVETSAFATREGQTNKGWEWDVDEERDERDEGVDGLMGEGDLYPAIGVFGGVEFEVRFGQGQT